jgi:protein-disulfide isomerase
VRNPFPDRKPRMLNRTTVTVIIVWLLAFAPPGQGQLAHEDPIIETGIRALRSQLPVPKEFDIRSVEKKESPIPDFYSVKLIISAPDRDIPIVVYVHKDGEKVIVGHLIVRGENVTLQEAGPATLRKGDEPLVGLEKSSFRGSGEAKVAVVEFANFECAMCATSWTTIRALLERRAGDVKYAFKHFPMQGRGKAFDISEAAAAVQEVSEDAFWLIHDFLFTEEGHLLLKKSPEEIRNGIGAILTDKGFDEKAYRTALDEGRGAKRVNDDLALGNRLRIRRTPTLFVNGDLIKPPLNDRVVDTYLKK